MPEEITHKCRHCGRSLYFGGQYWWHAHSEASFCDVGAVGGRNLQADPFIDDDAEMLVAASAMLAALKLALEAAKPTVKEYYRQGDGGTELVQEETFEPWVDAVRAAICQAEPVAAMVRREVLS